MPSRSAPHAAVPRSRARLRSRRHGGRSDDRRTEPGLTLERTDAGETEDSHARWIAPCAPLPPMMGRSTPDLERAMHLTLPDNAHIHIHLGGTSASPGATHAPAGGDLVGEMLRLQALLALRPAEAKPVRYLPRRPLRAAVAALVLV